MKLILMNGQNWKDNEKWLDWMASVEIILYKLLVVHTLSDEILS